MLMPKKVKYRKQHRGRMKGVASQGNKVDLEISVFRLWSQPGLLILRLRQLEWLYLVV